MKMLALGLGLANGLLWGFGGRDQESSQPETLRRRIVELEGTLPGKKQVAAWAARVQTALEIPPTDSPVAALARLLAIGGAAGFEFGEIAQQGENPWDLTFAGHGSYRAVAALLNELERSPAIRTNRIKLEETDDRRVETHIEAVIRSGPWTGKAAEGLPEPGSTTVPVPALGTQDLFGIESVTEAPQETRPATRFLGMYSGEGTPTVILEEDGTTALVPVGERTPAGNRVIAAQDDSVDLQDERGTSWKVFMEKPR